MLEGLLADTKEAFYVVRNVLKAIKVIKAVFDMAKTKKSHDTESDADRAYKSVMDDGRRVIRKIEHLVDEHARRQGISFEEEKKDR